MRQLVTARVVVNTDEVETLLAELQQAHPRLGKWIGSTLRKWILNKGPADKSVLQDTQGLPEWMLKQEAVNVKVEEVNQLIQPVLDYLEAMLDEKPNFALSQLGVDQAVKNAEAWHKKLAKAKKKNIVEDGTEVVMEFPDGYRWVRVFGIDSLTREGNTMGHCVGRGYYHQQTLLNKTTVYSLRDDDNVPHVTLDVSGDEVQQIKGKASKEVLPKYLGYVFEFLKKMKWPRVNFDEAKGIEQQYNQWLRATARKINGIAVWQAPRTMRNYVCLEKDGEITELPVPLTDFEGMDLSPEAIAAYAEYVMHAPQLMKDVQERWNRGPFLSYMTMNLGRWGQPAPAIRPLIQMFTGYPDALIFARGNGGIFFADGMVVASRYAPGATILEAMETLPAKAPDHPGYTPSTKVVIPEEERRSESYTKTLHTLHANDALSQGDTPAQMVDNLLKSQNQPTLEKLRTLKDVVPSDAAYKSVGVPIGGTSIMATALVLALCMNKNTKAALQYLVSKPHALRNWSGMLLGEVPATIQRLKLAPETQQQLIEILQGAYKQLIPAIGSVDATGSTQAVLSKVESIRVKTPFTLKNLM